MPALTPDPPAYPRFGLADAFVIITCIAAALAVAASSAQSDDLGHRLAAAILYLPAGLSLGGFVSACRLRLTAHFDREPFTAGEWIFLVILAPYTLYLGARTYQLVARVGPGYYSSVLILTAVFCVSFVPLVLFSLSVAALSDRQHRRLWTHRFGVRVLLIALLTTLLSIVARLYLETA